MTIDIKKTLEDSIEAFEKYIALKEKVKQLIEIIERGDVTLDEVWDSDLYLEVMEITGACGCKPSCNDLKPKIVRWRCIDCSRWFDFDDDEHDCTGENLTINQ